MKEDKVEMVNLYYIKANRCSSVVCANSSDEAVQLSKMRGALTVLCVGTVSLSIPGIKVGVLAHNSFKRDGCSCPKPYGGRCK